ncbi:MAG: recombination mediator RecR [Bacteroidales bacterium]|jgi:recombination protein RecR|nr:recombination mediator RecR [Bacteroidales bacterium]
MGEENYPSKLLKDAVDELSKLPGIGRKTALRLALHLLKDDENSVTSFGQSIIKMRKEITYCKVCHNISDEETCTVCSSPKRDKSLICVVESTRDVMAIESTQQYKGVYHVLGGIISPMDGVGPSDLNIKSLEERITNTDIKEVILALSTTMEGDTTNFYIYKKLRNHNIKLSTLSRGVAIGDELEYADEVTLGRSLINRTNFEPDNQ